MQAYQRKMIKVFVYRIKNVLKDRLKVSLLTTLYEQFFLYESVLRNILYLVLTGVILVFFCAKASFKLLVQLTTGASITNIL